LGTSRISDSGFKLRNSRKQRVSDPISKKSGGGVTPLFEKNWWGGGTPHPPTHV
jgi:hypothetical protein